MRSLQCLRQLRRWLGSAGVMLVVGLGAACAESAGTGRDASAPTVRDSAGIRLIDNGPLDTTGVLATPEPALEIGVVEGAEEYQLFRVLDVKRLSDGAIAVANGGSREVRVYEADGTHRVTMGGAGQGPAEFRYPSSLAILPGDTIQVQDMYDRVYFSPDGAFIRRDTHDRQQFMELWNEVGGMSEGGSWVPDGTFMAPLYEGMGGRPRPGPLQRPAITVLRVSGDLQSVDSLRTAGGILQQFVDVGGERGVTPVVPPFATNTSWSVAPSDGTIVVSDNAAPEVHRFHPDGSHSVVRWAAEPEEVTPDEVEAWKERQRAASWTQDRLPRLERAWAAMDTPARKPFFGRVTAGSDGTLWLTPGDYQEGAMVLRAFDAQGRFRGRATVQGPFTVFDSGRNWMVGVLRDENEIERVRVYRLTGGR